MADPKIFAARVDTAATPPRWRRWNAYRYGDHMGLCNTSFLGALWFCIVATVTGKGPAYYARTHRG